MVGNVTDGVETVAVHKVGPVRARFAGIVDRFDLIAPGSMAIACGGKGSVASYAMGAQTTLIPSNTGTLPAYVVEANVGGKISQLVSRIIDGFARKEADDFSPLFQDPVNGSSGDDDAPEAAVSGVAEGTRNRKKVVQAADRLTSHRRTTVFSGKTT